MKKGQMQINETILVLFIFMVLLGIGLVGFFRYNQYSVNQIDETDRMNYFFNMLGTFSNIPEIKCSELNKDMECIDAIKLMAFKDKGEFGFSKITVQKVYPILSEEECDLDKLKNKKECGLFTLYDLPKKDYTNKDVIYSPISIFYPNEDKYYLGQLKIEVYR